MKKYSDRSKLEHKKSLLDTAKSAAVHVMVFSAISLAGHGVTTSLSASIGNVGSAIVPPIGGMFLI